MSEEDTLESNLRVFIKGKGKAVSDAYSIYREDPGWDPEWEADQIQQGNLKGNAKTGSNCEECRQIIVDKSHRYYPALCETCSSRRDESYM